MDTESSGQLPTAKRPGAGPQPFTATLQSAQDNASVMINATGTFLQGFLALPARQAEIVRRFAEESVADFQSLTTASGTGDLMKVELALAQRQTDRAIAAGRSLYDVWRECCSNMVNAGLAGWRQEPPAPGPSKPARAKTTSDA